MPDIVAQTSERRLDLWRRGILLFDRTTVDKGAFHAAGYTEFTLEPELEGGLTPDLFASSRSHYVICEMSLSPHKDVNAIRKYGNVQVPAYLRTLHGLRRNPRPGGAPFFITNAHGFRDFPKDINGIKVSSPAEVHVADVSDDKLRNSLDHWTGFIRPPPNYSLLALPESDNNEIRRPLGGLLKQRASAKEALAAEDAADLLLGDLAETFPPKAKRGLVRKIRTLLEAAADALGDLANWDRGRSRIVFLKEIEQTQARKAFDQRLAAWTGTRFIEEWYTDTLSEDEEEDNDDDIW